MTTTLTDKPPEQAAGAKAAAPLPAAPPVPQSIEDTGLSPETVGDLLLKSLYVQGARTGQQLVETVLLPFPMVDDQLLSLQQRRFIEVRGTKGPNRGSYLFDITADGRDRARAAMEANQYVGPAPVPLDHYREWIRRQTIRNVHVTRKQLEEGFSHIVIKDEVLDLVGPAINSARSLFLYGDPGNGKTLMAEAISDLLGGAVYVPYAVDIDGQIMVTYDPVYHKPVPDPGPGPGDGEMAWLREASAYDRRFVRVQRPVVITGGELTLEQLDLQYDRFTKMYQAPFQVKANGGVLIIDDFGRQRVPPRDLLNRWIVPLEKRVDYLTLHTGVKFPVEFDCLLVFSTNLQPDELADEAFWRRIHYKMYVHSPEREEFSEIFRRCCDSRDIAFNPGAVDYLYREYYDNREIAPRGCHPRDLLDHLVDSARFMDTRPELTRDLIDRACESYFIDVHDLEAGANS